MSGTQKAAAAGSRRAAALCRSFSGAPGGGTRRARAHRLPPSPFSPGPGAARRERNGAMPLLHRKPFVREKPPADLRPDERVFYCRVTNEIFRDYE